MSVEAIGTLHEPVRRAVYELAVARGAPVTRNDVADALGIGRTLAAHHLDRLVDAGLLEVSSARRTGGPGAGRPAKLYRRAAVEHAASLPPRDYRLLAEVFAAAAEELGAESAVYEAARRRGAALAGPAPVEPVELLDRLGYEPYAEPEAGRLRLRNCPFDSVAKGFPPLVCGANLAFLQGALPGCRVQLDPLPTGCCVVVDPNDCNDKDD
jgi:predicted ArsR family transcriptional regulator